MRSTRSGSLRGYDAGRGEVLTRVLATVLILLVVAVLLFELAEHVVLPLLALRWSRGRRPVTGAEGMVGKLVEVRRWHGREGTVMADGELWTAASAHQLATGDRAVVREVRGLRLRVEPLSGAGE